MKKKKVRLGVNLDHVTTLRQVRNTPYPDLIEAIRIAEASGADGITVHLREDRRHIQDKDVYAARDVITTSMNLEMAATSEMQRIAVEVKPDYCCIVPERREELTTEGGLDVVAHRDRLKNLVEALHDKNINVSLFNWENDIAQVRSFEHGEIHNLESFLEEDGTPFYASTVRNWVCHKLGGIK